jgi:Fe-S-cluster-containing dehydrogenase component
MARRGMVIDVGRCIGCYNCFLACRDEHAGNDHRPITLAQPATGHRWINIREQERGSFPKVKVSHIPLLCLQCGEAPCIGAATSGAVYRREDGIVLIDPDKAAGQRDLVSSCPHRVIFWNEAENVPQKCTFCAHLLDAGWKEPRCVEVCPTQALVFGDLSDPDSEVAKQRAANAVEELHAEYGLQPSVSFLRLPKRFVTGEVVLTDKAELAAEGVGISLQRNERVLTTATDNYGDFEFDGLEADVEYVLRIEHPGYRRHELSVRTRNDLNVGTILLAPEARAPDALEGSPVVPENHIRA